VVFIAFFAGTACALTTPSELPSENFPGTSREAVTRGLRTDETVDFRLVGLAVSMDNLTCGGGYFCNGVVTEQGMVQNLDGRDISQIGCFGDLSDGIYIIQQSKIIAD